MRTPEDLAACDAELVDTEPELDRRLIRCGCLHSLDAHRQDYDPRALGPNGVWPNGATSCERCGCDRFTTRPQPWRVTFRPLDPDDCGLLTLWPWLVISPRGTRMYEMADRTSAINLARSMAALDDTLGRVARMEHHLSPAHPAGRGVAAQEPDSAGEIMRAISQIDRTLGTIAEIQQMFSGPPARPALTVIEPAASTESEN